MNQSQDSRSVSPSSQDSGSQFSSREPTPSLYFTPAQSPSVSPSPPPVLTPTSTRGKSLNAYRIPPHASFSGKSFGNSLPPQVQLELDHLFAQGIAPPLVDPFARRLAYAPAATYPISVSSASSTPEPPASAFVQGSSWDGHSATSSSAGSNASRVPETDFVWDFSTESQSASISSKRRRMSEEPDSDYEVRSSLVTPTCLHVDDRYSP